MVIAIVHNAYGRPSGEEIVVESLVRNLEQHGHTVPRFQRCSAEIDRMPFGQIRAFFSGIYNPASRRQFRSFLQKHQPDVVHVHNVFPLISPSVLVEARRQRVPVVMTVHNFRLVCPSGLLMRNGQPCHDCLGGREYRCIVTNCEGRGGKSLGYALRTAIARKRRWFLNNVDRFICLNQFQHDLHLREGFPPERCSVIPNAVPTEFLATPSTSEKGADSFVGYVGRLSPEKDIPVLFKAARALPHIPIKLAGTLARMPDLPRQGPANVQFLGQLDRGALRDFYASMRLLVFPTRCYEGLPTVPLEAMAAGLPVVCTRIGGLPEMVNDVETGFLVPPGDPVELASKIKLLWENKELATQMGRAGRIKVLRDYHPDTVYAQHLAVYKAVAASAA